MEEGGAPLSVWALLPTHAGPRGVLASHHTLGGRRWEEVGGGGRRGGGVGCGGWGGCVGGVG